MQNKNPTPYHDINIVINYFLNHIKEILGPNFIGMYLYGSLATGDFDKNMSDIDFIVITNTEIPENEFILLRELHQKSYLNDSPWSKKIEAAYIAKKELGNYESTISLYPQIEKGRELIKDKLEMGWPFQCFILREYGIVIEGPEPHQLFEPVNKNYMLQAAKLITNLWKQQAHDEREAGWLIQKDEQVFVVITLCRFLYFGSEGKIASKQLAAHWALANLEKKWHKLIKEAITTDNQTAIVHENDVIKTTEFIDYTALALNNSKEMFF